MRFSEWCVQACRGCAGCACTGQRVGDAAIANENEQPNDNSAIAMAVRPLSMFGYDAVTIDPPWPFEVRSETDKAKSAEAHDQTREFRPSRAGLISTLGQASLRPTKQKPPGGSSGHAEQVARPTCAHPAVWPSGGFGLSAWFSAHPSCTPLLHTLHTCTPAHARRMRPTNDTCRRRSAGVRASSRSYSTERVI